MAYETDAEEFGPDSGAAGSLARTAAFLCDLGFVALIWLVGSLGTSMFNPVWRAPWDEWCLRYGAVAYLILTSMSFTETPGQQLVGIRILDELYSPLNPFRVLARTVFFLLSLPLAPVNLILISLLKRKRAIHDFAAKTRVMTDPAASRIRLAVGVLLAVVFSAGLWLLLNLFLRDFIELRSVLPKSAPAAEVSASLAGALNFEQ